VPRSQRYNQIAVKKRGGAPRYDQTAVRGARENRNDSGFFPHAYFRQSNAFDLGAMAKRAGAKYLMLTHLIPPLGAERQGPFKIPGGPLSEADYRKAVEESGFTGKTIVRTDLATLRLPAK
jgi:ribonuclease Z